MVSLAEVGALLSLLHPDLRWPVFFLLNRRCMPWVQVEREQDAQLEGVSPDKWIQVPTVRLAASHATKHLAAEFGLEARIPAIPGVQSADYWPGR